MAEDLLPRGNRIGMIPEEMKAQLKMPLLRPEVMAEPIVWLASEQSDEITGERMRRRSNGMKISKRIADGLSTDARISTLVMQITYGVRSFP